MPTSDKRASTFKEKAANREIVVPAFHVGYQDYIGSVDRFAAQPTRSAKGLLHLKMTCAAFTGCKWCSMEKTGQIGMQEAEKPSAKF